MVSALSAPLPVRLECVLARCVHRTPLVFAGTRCSRPIASSFSRATDYVSSRGTTAPRPYRHSKLVAFSHWLCPLFCSPSHTYLSIHTVRVVFYVAGAGPSQATLTRQAAEAAASGRHPPRSTAVSGSSGMPALMSGDDEEEAELQRAIRESLAHPERAPASKAPPPSARRRRNDSDSSESFFFEDSDGELVSKSPQKPAAGATSAPLSQQGSTTSTSSSSSVPQASPIVLDSDSDADVPGSVAGAKRARPADVDAETMTSAPAAKSAVPRGSSSTKAAPSASIILEIPPAPEVLPPEPTVGTLARLQLKLPDGRRAQRKFLASQPLAYVYYWASTLLGTAHPIATAFQRALPVDATADDAGAVTGATIKATTFSGVMLSHVLSPESTFKPKWDLMRPHPAKSLAVEGCAGATLAEAGLMNAQLIVQLLV